MLLTRSDGRRIRSLPPMQKIIPYIMRSRAASINLFQEHVDCTPLNNYICAHEVNGQRTMSTMHLLIAAIVRVVAQRPQLNRFVVHSRVYARKDIVVSFVVHRSLRIEDGGTNHQAHLQRHRESPPNRPDHQRCHRQRNRLLRYAEQHR